MLNVYYQNLTALLYGITATLLALPTVAVVLRLISRRLSPVSFWWDDWTITVALVSSDSSRRPLPSSFLDSLT